MPSWEVHTRLQIVRNKKKDEEERKALEGGYAKIDNILLNHGRVHVWRSI